MENGGLKIIAIKPLLGCNPDYLKILKPDTIYYFYSDYHIDENDKISCLNTMPKGFYKTNSIEINISAIVGNNGSGKSTIIELLFRTINNLAESQDSVSADLKKIPQIKVEIYFQTNCYYKIKVDNYKIEYYRYTKSGAIISEKENAFSLKNFFYTIAVNYSHYAYNTKDLHNEVNWLDGLFHKNDGYQTPLVINPMRTEGNIDINTENHLVKSRLIVNLLRPLANTSQFNFRNITDKLEAVSLELKLNKGKGESTLYELVNENGTLIEEVTISSINIDREKILRMINAIYSFKYALLDKDKYKIALDYLIYKIVSIAIKYDEYLKFYSKDKKEFKLELFDRYIRAIIKDKSHITFKLKQTLRFLRYQHIELKTHRISLSKLSEEIESILKNGRKSKLELIEFIPPPFFDIEIILNAQDSSEKDIEFTKLSSGEKQMIYSVNSLLYHLMNLNSITNTKTRRNYKYVNIILEEIELYFHPEMQRRYISYLLSSIDRLELSQIKSINFCFVTHSPFILSDIPNSNILFLNEQGLPQPHPELNTFGGNIHELLAHSFFLGSGLIGEFAKTKIQIIIDTLSPKSLSSDKILANDSSNTLKEIMIIGEPFIRDKLLEMYYKKYPDEHQKQTRIAVLKRELKKLESND